MYVLKIQQKELQIALRQINVMKLNLEQLMKNVQSLPHQKQVKYVLKIQQALDAKKLMKKMKMN